ncbi:MAG TPA: hypothetical protein VH740_15570 [Vicinamibacterales bacterium]|jgi:hypothetical protein
MTHLLILIAIAGMLLAAPQHTHPADRAQQTMGFDQHKTTHHFLLEAGGGTIEVTANDADDRASLEQIRMHLRHIASAFQEGNFEAPFLVHGMNPPGVDVLKDRRASMTYRFEEVPKGAKVVMRTADAAAKAALHDFLRFQIREHRTGDPLKPTGDAK